jgi:hypothetical protein
MKNNFKGLIWTNHAIDRLRERGISQGTAWATWRHPESSKKGTSPNSWIYYRTYGREKIEVVAKKNEKGEWIILSVWSKNIRTNKSKDSFWKKIIDFVFN